MSKLIFFLLAAVITAIALSPGDRDLGGRAAASPSAAQVCASESTNVTTGDQITDTVCASSGGSIPQIIHPAAGSVICGSAELIGMEANPDLFIEDSLVAWEYSLDGSSFQTIPANPMAPDSFALPGGTTVWDSPALASGQALLRLRLTYGQLFGSTTSTFVLSRPPVNGQIIADFDDISDATTLSAPDAVDPDGSIVNYRWLLGDGSELSGATVQHTYAAGDYVVVLETTDDDGCTTISTVQFTSPPAVPVAALPEVDYCDPLSVTINRAFQGQSTNNWPEYVSGGIPAGQWPLGRTHNANRATAYGFEVIFTVFGNPAKCDEFQLIKSTYYVELQDGTRREWRNPTANGFSGDFHDDNYTRRGTFKTHTPNANGTAEIAWIDLPGIPMDGNVGGTFNKATNPIVKAQTLNEVLVELDGQEAPIPHVEPGEGGPGETVFARFKICSAWNVDATTSSYAPVASGGPDAAPPAPAKDNVGPSGWVARAGALPGC